MTSSWRHFQWYAPHNELGLKLNMEFNLSIKELFQALLQCKEVVCIEGLETSPYIFIKVLESHTCYVQVSLEDVLDFVFRCNYNVLSVAQGLIQSYISNLDEFKACMQIKKQLKNFNGSLKRDTQADRKILVQELMVCKSNQIHIANKQWVIWPPEAKPVEVGQMGTHTHIPTIYNDSLLLEIVQKVQQFIQDENLNDSILHVLEL